MATLHGQLEDRLRRIGIVRYVTRASAVRSAMLGLTLAILGIVLAFVLSDFALGLMALFFTFAILAYSIDLIWGENRIVSFGHGAFFAGGAYIGGLILLGQSYNIVGGHTNYLLGGTGGTSTLDSTLKSLNSATAHGLPILALIIPPVAMGVVGLLVGVILFRVGSPEVYVPLATLGIGVIAALELNDVTAIGASNGLGNVPGFTFTFDGGNHPLALYAFNGVFLALVVAGYALFRRSRFGLIWRSAGDDPIRLEALGYRVWLIRAAGFGASAALAGLAGTLYISSAHYFGPQTAGVIFSAQALIWVAVGGVGTVLGPLIGTLAVKWGEQYLSSDLGLTDSWPLLLGVLLILVVIVVPSGLVGIGERLTTLRKWIGRDRGVVLSSSPAALTFSEDEEL